MKIFNNTNLFTADWIAPVNYNRPSRLNIESESTTANWSMQLSVTTHHSCSARAKRTLFSAKSARTLANFIMTL